MKSNVKVILLVGLALLVVAIGVWLGRSERRPPVPEPESTASVASTERTVTPRPAEVVVPTNSPPLASVPTEPSSTNQSESTNLLANWEEKVEDILKLDIEDKEIAKQLIAIFPRLPTDGQIDVVQHISNLLPDENYPEVAKLMNDDKLPEDVLNQLFMDLLNRKTTVLLPELVEIARNPQHPTAGEAKDFLELYLENDYGTDWNLWSVKVKEYLTANPD